MLGRDAAQVLLQQVQCEWQLIKGIRRRMCTNSGACEVPGTASSSKKRSILKRAPSFYSLAASTVEGTPCRTVKLLDSICIGEGSSPHVAA